MDPRLQMSGMTEWGESLSLLASSPTSFIGDPSERSPPSDGSPIPNVGDDEEGIGFLLTDVETASVLIPERPSSPGTPEAIQPLGEFHQWAFHVFLPIDISLQGEDNRGIRLLGAPGWGLLLNHIPFSLAEGGVGCSHGNFL